MKKITFRAHVIRRLMDENALVAVKRGEDPRSDARPLMVRVMIELYRREGFQRKEARERAQRFVARHYDSLGYQMSDERYIELVDQLDTPLSPTGVIDDEFETLGLDGRDVFKDDHFKIAV